MALSVMLGRGGYLGKGAQLEGVALRGWHVIRHTVCPHTRSNQITRYRQPSRSPATPRVYTSVFRAPHWHGATQTHFLPRPRKSAWHCDITDAIWPRILPTHYKQYYHTIPPIIPLTSDTPRLHQRVSRSPAARHHANAPSTKAAQMRMALRHHGRNFATWSAQTLEAIISNTSESSSATLFPALHLYYTNCQPAPQVKRQVSKMSVSYETSSKSEAPSLQNQRFVRHRAQVSKTSVSCETSPKSEARPIQNAISPAFRALDTHDLRRGFARPIQNAISHAFRALDTHDLRRGLRVTNPKRNLT